MAPARERSFRWVVVGPVLQCTLLGLFAAVVGVATAVASRRVGERKAISDARGGGKGNERAGGGAVPMIRVLVVDDHAIVRTGLEQLLGTAGDIQVVATAADGALAVAEAGRVTPDIVLMDLSMPVMDGVEATRRITAEVPGAQVVVLTSFSDQQRILDALGAGASGYVLKDADPDELLAAIRMARSGR